MVRRLGAALAALCLIGLWTAAGAQTAPARSLTALADGTLRISTGVLYAPGDVAQACAGWINPAVSVHVHATYSFFDGAGNFIEQSTGNTIWSVTASWWLPSSYAGPLTVVRPYEWVDPLRLPRRLKTDYSGVLAGAEWVKVEYTLCTVGPHCGLGPVRCQSQADQVRAKLFTLRL